MSEVDPGNVTMISRHDCCNVVYVSYGTEDKSDIPVVVECHRSTAIGS